LTKNTPRPTHLLASFISNNFFVHQENLPECFQEINVHAGKWCTKLPDNFLNPTPIEKLSVAFGERALYGNGGKLYGSILSNASRCLLLKCTDNTDFGSVNEYSKELSLEAEEADPPIPKAILNDLNRAFLQILSRFMAITVLFGSNFFALFVEQNWFHEKMKEPVLGLERTGSTNLSGVIDPRPGDICYSAASRDFAKILALVDNLIYTATWEQQIKMSISSRLPTMGRAIHSTRHIMSWVMATKVVSSWTEFHLVMRKNLTRKPMMCTQFMYVWPMIRTIAVHKKAFREMIPDMLFGESGTCLRKMVKQKKLHLQGYPINLKSKSNRTTLPTDPAWHPKGKSSHGIDSTEPEVRPVADTSEYPISYAFACHS